MGPKIEYSTVSIPKRLAEKIDDIIEETGYWPSRSAFVRDAVLEKIDRLSQK